MNATRNWKEETVAGACESRPLVRDGAALRIQIQSLLLAASLGAGSVIALRAQVVNDGATNLLANVTNIFTGSVTVGTNGSFTLLVLADSALLTNSAHGVIGRNANAKSNQVQLISATARWLMGNTLFVGSNGAGNRLVVSNGAAVVAGVDGFLGYSPGASNNVAFVTGAGSGWTSDGLYVGYQEGRNQLVVSNGGVVANRIGLLGYFSIANNNAAVVTGTGSVWSNRLNLIVGLDGAGNRLDVSNGAAVVADVDGFLGYNPGASNNVAVVTGVGSLLTSDSLLVGYQEGRNQLVASNGAVVADRVGYLGYFSNANNNTAVVTGAGSVWSNGLNLHVGLDGAGNRLDVNNGGLVAANNVNVGVASSSLNNRVVVNGGTLRASDGAGAGVLDVRRGTNVLNAGLVDVDRLLLTNTAGRFELLGGTLVTRGARVNNGVPMTIGPAGASPAVWDVRPGVTDHILNLSVVVGNSSPGHQLLVSGGALLTNGSGSFIGSGAGADMNSASVSGAGSRWRTSADLVLGAGGALNQLTVSGGGSVGAANGRVGVSATGSDNVALVTGLGSVWSNAASVTVGEAGLRNQLQVRNGGAVVAAVGGSIGLNNTANANTVLVADAGSRWGLASDLFVGSSGSGNQLTVQNGGLVDNQSGRIGDNAGSINNVALVSGSGSIWSNRANVIVGFSGAGNQLLVNNGGWVVAGAGSTIGSQVSAPGNVATVTGLGSVWSSAGGLTVGNLADGNRLLIEAGGRVDCTRGIIGFGTGSNNVAVVTGAGSVWSNSVELQVGGFGPNNQLILSNGAVVVTDVDGFLGHDPGASNNVAWVTGTGSLLTSDSLLVGYQDGRNQLVVSNGGMVVNRVGLLGYFSIANNNAAVVTGAGSVWSNWLNLFVGFDGAGNRLEVNNGGRLVASNASIGFAPTANGNTVVAAGAGSTWNNLASLVVGENGSGNTLIANSGATVASSSVFVGLNSVATNNRVTVNGGTLRVANPAGTGVLDVRRGTNALNAGLVDVDQLVLTNRGVLPNPTVFGNGSSNNLSALGPGPATIYPSTIAVAGLPGFVTKVTVTLSNFSAYPRGIDMLLVSPAGQKVMIMSDASDDTPIGPVRLTFDDAAASALPDSTVIVSGTYRPTDYEPGETMPSPAPTGPYSTELSSFNGSNPNGSWSFYIQDDSGISFGNLQGWSVQIATDEDPSLGAGLFEFHGGTLVTRGAFINNGLPFVVGGPGGVPAVWEVQAGAGSHVVNHRVIVGGNSSFNQLLVTNGAFLTNTTVGIIGHGASAHSNLVSVSGASSQWRMPGDLFVGHRGSGNGLVVGTGGVVAPGGNVFVGDDPASSSNNLLRLAGGTLRVMNPGGTGTLEVRGGTNRLDAGLVDVDHLVVTNARGQVEFNGGTLRTPDTLVANGRVFTVGGGASLATLQLLGGTHTFANNLTVANNASLIGNGLVDGTVTVAAGGKLIPGAPIGGISVLGTVILQGAVNLQIDKSGGLLTNDQVTASGAIFYSGALNVTDIGTDVLAAGDRFFLFDATPYVGAFTTLSLPPLGPGLSWVNNLLVDGSIEVVAAGQPGFASIIRSGTNVVFAGTNGTPGANYAVLTTTNVALPLANWVSIATNQFSGSGGFSFTNAIVPDIPQRFFLLRIP